MKLSTNNVTIKGLAQLEAKFKALQENTQGRILENAATSGALPIQNAAIEKAPYEFGTLRRSIHTTVTNSSATRVDTETGTDLEYAPYQEFGTAKMPAHPYLRPAFDEQQNAAKSEVAAALLEQIKHI